MPKNALQIETDLTRHVPNLSRPGRGSHGRPTASRVVPVPQVMYVRGSGPEEKIVVLADEEYNEIEIPLARFVGHSTVAEGATCIVYRAEEEIVKIAVKP